MTLKISGSTPLIRYNPLTVDEQINTIIDLFQSIRFEDEEPLSSSSSWNWETLNESQESYNQSQLKILEEFAYDLPRLVRELKSPHKADYLQKLYAFNQFRKEPPAKDPSERASQLRKEMGSFLRKIHTNDIDPFFKNAATLPIPALDELLIFRRAHQNMSDSSAIVEGFFFKLAGEQRFELLLNLLQSHLFAIGDFLNINVNPLFFSNTLLLGLANQLADKKPEAAKRVALLTDQQSQNIIFSNIARTYIKEGDLVEAFNAIKLVHDVTQKKDAVAELIKSYIKKGEVEEAFDLLPIISTHYNKKEIYKSLFEQLCKQNRLELALQHHSFDGIDAIGIIQRNFKNLDVEKILQFIEDPLMDSYKNGMLEFIAKQFIKENKLEEAQKLIALIPATTLVNGNLMLHLTEFLIKNNQIDEAIIYSSTIQHPESKADAIYKCINKLTELNQLDQALKLVQQLPPEKTDSAHQLIALKYLSEDVTSERPFDMLKLIAKDEVRGALLSHIIDKMVQQGKGELAFKYFQIKALHDHIPTHSLKNIALIFYKNNLTAESSSIYTSLWTELDLDFAQIEIGKAKDALSEYYIAEGEKTQLLKNQIKQHLDKAYEWALKSLEDKSAVLFAIVELRNQLVSYSPEETLLIADQIKTIRFKERAYSSIIYALISRDWTKYSRALELVDTFSDPKQKDLEIQHIARHVVRNNFEEGMKIVQLISDGKIRELTLKNFSKKLYDFYNN